MELLEGRYVEVLKGPDHTWYMDRWKPRLIAKFDRQKSIMSEGGMFAGDDQNYVYDGAPVDIDVMESVILSISHGRLNMWQVAPKSLVGTGLLMQESQTIVVRFKDMTSSITTFFQTLHIKFNSMSISKQRWKVVACKDVRDGYTSSFMSMLKRFASKTVEVKECQQFFMCSEYANTTDEDLITMVFLLVSPVFRAFYSPDVRVSGFIESETYMPQSTMRFESLLKSKDLRLFTKKIVGFECPRILRQVAKYMSYRRPMTVTKILPEVMHPDAIVNSIAADYYLEDIEVGDDKSINIRARPYTVQSLEPLFMLRSVWEVTKNVDLVCDTMDWMLGNEKFMQRWSLKFRGMFNSNSHLTAHHAEKLRGLGTSKCVRLLKEAIVQGGFSELRDAIRQWLEYDDPESIHESVRGAFPDGLKPPKKFKSLKEFHDLITRDYAAIKKAGHANTPILYSEEVLKLDGAEVLDTRLVLPKVTGDLIEWGTLLNNCIGSYNRRAATGQLLLFALYVGEEVKMVGEINYGRIQQLVENRNAPVNKRYNAAVEALLTPEMLQSIADLTKLYPEIQKAEEFDGHVAYLQEALMAGMAVPREQLVVEGQNGPVGNYQVPERI